MTRILAIALALAAMVLSACGGSGTAPSQGSQGTPSTPDPDPEPAAAAGEEELTWEGATAVDLREMTHAVFGFWQDEDGIFTGYVGRTADNVGRPTTNGTWRGTAVTVDCEWDEACNPDTTERYFGRANITYSAADNEVNVGLTDWRDALGTLVHGYLYFREPITLDNFKAASEDDTFPEFIGRKFDGNQLARVSFFGDGNGQPSEALGVWYDNERKAAFGATRQAGSALPNTPADPTPADPTPSEPGAGNGAGGGDAPAPAPDPNRFTWVESRTLTNARFGLFTNAEGIPSAHYEPNNAAVAMRPSVNGSWRGTAIGHNCGSNTIRICGTEFSLFGTETYIGTANIAYTAGEVTVGLSDWRDSDGTRLQGFRDNLLYPPITLSNFVESAMEFRGRRAIFNTSVRVRFYGGSEGSPAEAFGIWQENTFEASFGGTRQ